MKNIRMFYLKIFSFLVVKFSVYFNRHVFVMWYYRTKQKQKIVVSVSVRVFMINQSIQIFNVVGQKSHIGECT